MERYLNAKYPNMAHGADLDQQIFDDDEQLEEISEEKSNPARPTPSGDLPRLDLQR